MCYGVGTLKYNISVPVSACMYMCTCTNTNTNMYVGDACTCKIDESPLLLTCVVMTIQVECALGGHNRHRHTGRTDTVHTGSYNQLTGLHNRHTGSDVQQLGSQSYNWDAGTLSKMGGTTDTERITCTALAHWEATSCATTTGKHRWVPTNDSAHCNIFVKHVKTHNFSIYLDTTLCPQSVTYCSVIYCQCVTEKAVAVA